MGAGCSLIEIRAIRVIRDQKIDQPADEEGGVPPIGNVDGQSSKHWKNIFQGVEGDLN